jgi:hypothetical protein
MVADVDNLTCHLHHPTDGGWQAWIQSPLTGIVNRAAGGGVGWEHLFRKGWGEAPGMGYVVWC